MSNPREKYGVSGGAQSVLEIDDMQFTLRSASSANRAYTYAAAIAGSKRRDDLAAGEVRGMSALEDVLIEAFAETVITSWTGVDDENGNPLPFTRENCIALLQDCPPIWDEIKEAARDPTRFRRPTVREDGDALGKS